MRTYSSLRLLLGIILLCTTIGATSQWNPNYSIGTSTGKYVFNYNQATDNLVEINSPTYTGGTFSYQWYQSQTPEGVFTPISNAIQSSYSPGVLAQTTYYRRKVTDGTGNFIYSNVIKIEVGSVNWEDLNYVREHDVLVPGITDWKAVDQLPIGQKLQTTTYLDGLGRPVQKVSSGTATPAQGSSLWGDVVQFYEYDEYGRQVKQYLPYTTTSQTGKFKSLPVNRQAEYYTNVYNESSPYSVVYYENNPLNRVKNVKSPGTSWANSPGNSASYEINDAGDNVQIFTIGYNSGDAPVRTGTYDANTLFKTSHTDENLKQVIEYTNKSGQVILTKTQITDNPSAGHDGWICVYSVYDDFGLLRYRIQPEAVKYLDANGWSFAGTNGQQVLNEQCFRYEYDDKGRNILKKAPGAKDLRMLYDQRDRVVFMQDGNQRVKNPPEWTANLYDDLDRPVITTLYRTTKAVANLQNDINGAATVTTVSTGNGGQGGVSDLSVNYRDVSIQRYVAQNSIEFVDSFTSVDNDYFIAEIDPTAGTQGYTVNTVTYGNPISAPDLNNPSISTIVKYQFYDDYSFSRAKLFDNNFDNTTAYSNSEALPVAPSKRTISYPTGSMVRVLGTNTFLGSTEYYDEKGRHIQSIEENIKSASDVTTLQYHWDGRLMSTYTKHSAAGGYSNFGILTKNLFDKIGRVTSVQKKYGSNGFKTIASYDFDDVGRLKTKHLDPSYPSPFGGAGGGLEGFSYSYNIHNNITGINKDYALKTGGSYNKWGNFFGLYLGYDNRDNVFNAAKLDGHVTGLLWNTQGDDAQRKYDYEYDNAGRLTKATFNERQTTGAAWDNSKMDFTVSGRNGKIEYDLNGNLKFMLQKGVMPGNQSPVSIDDLQYEYAQYSNKLMKVTDNSTTGNANGSLGDFKDGNNGGDDYVYDDNGNLVSDQNKRITNITYNFLDKPESFTITPLSGGGGAAIQLVYDAEGNKLQKKYTAEGSSTTKITTYINQFVYEGASLKYINFEEGRIRVIQPVSENNGLDGLAIDGNMDLPNGMKGAYDYFIRDYQENVRMILTEESHYSIGQCTMETSRATNEEPVFGQTGGANEVSATRFTKPTGWTSNTSNSVTKLSKLTGHTIGPNSLLKVMAGDVLNAKADYYYPGPVTNNSNSLVTDVVNNLVMAISGSAVTNSSVKGGTIGISTNLNGSVPLANVADPNRYATDNIPRAYLNILFFDERFNFVPENSTAVRVSQSGDGAAPLVLPANIKAPKNGYAYIYVSNENDQPVYFDNLQVSDNRGRIIEENHYYAFGLKIAGISSVKLPDPNEGNINNNNLYNDKELIDEADLNWYDYGFRNYDAQVGRFTQLDPLTDEYPYYTPYQFAGNEPIANVDVDGLEPWNVLPGVTVTGTKAASKSVSLVSAFKAVMHAVPGAAGALSNLIPANKTGEAIVGGVVGVGEASRDALAGTYNMVRHPINTLNGIAEMSTLQGQVNAGVNVAMNYTQSSSQFGEGFTKARYISYGITSIGIAVAGPKVLKGANQFAAETFVNFTKKAGSFSKVEGFSLRFGSNDFAYNNSYERAITGKWTTPTSFSNSHQAFHSLALDYRSSANFAQMKFSLKNWGLYVKGIASPQNTTLGGGSQLLKTRLSFKTKVRPVGFPNYTYTW